MAVPFERLLARVGCCRLLLSGLDETCLPAASLSQRNALADMIPRCAMDADQRATLVTELASCKFLETDKIAILSGAAGEKPSARGKLSQDYTEFHNYFTDQLQQRFLDGEITPGEMTYLLFDMLGKLGMRRGDEHTYKRIASFIMVHAEPSKDSMTPKTKWQYKNEIRDKFLKYVRTQKLPTPPSVCTVLPGNPTAMALLHEELYKAVLGKSVPSKCRMNMIDVIQFDNTYTCRNEGGNGVSCGSRGNGVGCGSQMQVAVQPQTANDPNLIDQMNTFASFMMKGLKQIQDSNMQMFSQLVGRPASKLENGTVYNQGRSSATRATKR